MAHFDPEISIFPASGARVRTLAYENDSQELDLILSDAGMVNGTNLSLPDRAASTISCTLDGNATSLTEDPGQGWNHTLAWNGSSMDINCTYPPKVWDVGPSSFKSGENVALEANVTDHKDGGDNITAVAYYAYASSPGNWNEANLTYNGTSGLFEGAGFVPTENFDLYVVATDSDGASVTSGTVEVTTPFLDPAFSPAYGNPGGNFTFTVTVNDGDGDNVTPVVWIVDENNNTVFSANGTLVEGSGTSTAVVNITQTGDWRYFWNYSDNGTEVRYPVSGYLDGPEVDYFRTMAFTVESGITEISIIVGWSNYTTNDSTSYVVMKLVDPEDVSIPQFANTSQPRLANYSGKVTTRNRVARTLYLLPIIDYTIIKVEGYTQMTISDPKAGQWQLLIFDESLREVEVEIDQR